jgi:hypothetical protein
MAMSGAPVLTSLLLWLVAAALNKPANNELDANFKSKSSLEISTSKCCFQFEDKSFPIPSQGVYAKLLHSKKHFSG